MSRHFNALDGWRGICALVVVIFHLEAYSHFRDLGLIQNAYLYVDFFFALSGFVIAANYTDALHDGFGIGRFMLLRLGRLYPLHLAVLLFFVVLECLPLLSPSLGAPGKVPFGSAGYDFSAAAADLLMLQSVGVQNTLGWNYPSWSISAEFVAYLGFAVATSILPRRALWSLLLLTALIGPLVLARLVPGHADVTYDFGWLRAVGGFSAGAIAFLVYRRLAPNRLASAAWMTAAEVAAVTLAAAFIAFYGQARASFAAPFVFMLVVLVFAFEGGLLSRLLSTRPFMLLGALSYSVYMTHAAVIRCIGVAMKAVGRIAGVDPFTHSLVQGESVAMLRSSDWMGDVLTVLALALTIVLSMATYRWIEVPARDAVRNFVRRRFVRREQKSVTGTEEPYPSKLSA